MGTFFTKNYLSPALRVTKTFSPIGNTSREGCENSRSIWRIKENVSRSWLDLECASRIAPCRICFQRSPRSLGPLRAQRKEPDRRGFFHFPSNVPSLPNSRERDSAVVISAFLPSRWVPYLKWEKAIMASVWITTDYNNSCGGQADGDGASIKYVRITGGGGRVMEKQTK